jgi:uncharacterized protein YndB with AHSA1/START domain
MSTRPSPIARASRRIGASPERTFAALIDPALVGPWMFGGEAVVRIAIDPRVGGRFSIVVRRAGQDLDHHGEYLAIDSPRRLAFTWGVGAGDRARVTVEVAPEPGSCVVTFAHELHPDWAHVLAHSEAAWARMLERLAAVLEAR